MARYEIAIKNFRKRLDDDAYQIAAQTVREMGDRVIDRTPVLSGQLVQNWRPSVDQINQDISTGIGPVRGVAKQRLQIFTSAVGKFKRLFFTNPVIYGPYIEYGQRRDGSRRTIPRLMVTLTVAEFQSIVRGVTTRFTGGRR